MRPNRDLSTRAHAGPDERRWRDVDDAGAGNSTAGVGVGDIEEHPRGAEGDEVPRW